MKVIRDNWFLILIIIVSAFLLLKNCEGEKGTITIPPIDGEFEPQEPVYIDRVDTVFVTKWRTKTDTIEIITKNPVNDSLAQLYFRTKDSLDRAQMYLNAIQIRQFSNKFEDDNILITTEGEVQGQLNWVKPSYTIKEREIEVPNNRWGVSIYAGYGVGEKGLSPQLGAGLTYRLFSF